MVRRKPAKARSANDRLLNSTVGIATRYTAIVASLIRPGALPDSLGLSAGCSAGNPELDSAGTPGS